MPPVTDRAKAATNAARLAAALPERDLTVGEVATLRSWTSLAQWVGTERGVAAVERVEQHWPGYGRAAAGSILNAYYTDTDVVLTVWAWLARHGVNAGVGFEPGCGRGDWIAAAPDTVRFDAVDIDPISVRVAAVLTGANVVESPIEHWHLGRSDQAHANGGYDVIVGNVPFSSHRPGVGNPHRDSLHNLAIARSLAMLRPGGVATVLTSRFSLDSKDAGWRRRLADHVDLVGAFRLPSRTHREAGTDVVTDLLILRRPHPGEQRPPADWLDTTLIAVADDGTTSTVNSYWTTHPDRVLGRVEPGGAYRRENFSVINVRPAHQALADGLATIDVDWSPAGTAPALDDTPPVMARTAVGRALPAGSIVADATSPSGFTRDGRPHPCTAKGRHQLGCLVTMRDRTLEYLDDPTDAARVELADLYGSYRQTYPPLNSYELVEFKPVKRRNRADADADVDEVDDDTGEATKSQRRYPKLEGFRSDPSWWSVAALEVFDDDTGHATPAAVLQRPIVADTRDAWPQQAANIEQAVANSLARWLRIDPVYVAGQLGVDQAVADGHLAEVAFLTPAGEWQLAAHYLAGDVVGKLDDAVTASATDPRQERNVAALQAVQPTPLTAAEITPEFGVTWLDADDIAAFIADHDGGTVPVRYHPPTGTWSFDGWSIGGPAQFRTDRHTMAEQVVRACNARPVTVYIKRQDGDREVTVIDPEATAAEQLCRDNLTEALQVWCWNDPERAGRLADRYNRLFNRYRAEQWDGSHLTLPGLTTDFTPRPHQKDVVWRILASADRGVLMAHGVGAGKTAAMIIAAQETRRTGRIAGTALFAVPGNMVEQFARDYLRLYPAARVLTPHGATQRDAVREFAARMATGDFDAAICSHNHLKTIPLSPEVESEVVQRRIAELTSVDEGATLSRAASKRVARVVEQEKARLAALRNAAEDPAVTYFDRMQVGMLFVDEAHLAKNIRLGSERQGLPMPAGSQRAEAILARADHVRAVHGDGAVVMATATPVTNSPAEMWVAARLVAPRALAAASLDHFDAMAANFLAPVETVEHGADGKLKVVTRLGEYKNFPDLARMFRSFADVRTTGSLGFALPELVGGKAAVHVAPPTRQQQIVAEWCAERAAGSHIEHLDNPDPVIAILGTARAAALHPATISPETCAKYRTRSFPALAFDWDEPNDKLIDAADRIAEIHHRTAGWTYPDSERPGAAQVVFCDAGIPNADETASVYSTLTDLLVERGIARREIAWVHDITDPNRRQTLWDQVRSGKTRVLIGSTMQMGVGVNIQTRLYAAHELTAPYRPDWLEQAEGRLIRQGNNNTTVEVHRYVTEHTADANSWQILQRKAHFIAQAMSDPEQMTRDLRDESVATVAEEFATIAAIATGDQRHIELAALTAATTRLERSERAHHASRAAQGRHIGQAERTITQLTAQVAAIDQLHPNPDGDPEQIGGQLLAMRWNQRSTLRLAGVDYEAHRVDGLTLEIPGTGLILRIAPDQLQQRGDQGRGLGQRVLNLHERLPALRADQTEQVARARRQVDAERARPVPPEFPRHAELVETRQHRDQLRADLMPKPDTPEAAETGDNQLAALIDGSQRVANSGAHPVYANRTPTTAERFAWAAAYDRYNPNTAGWGNRARGPQAWIDAVNTFTANPNNWHPRRRHDVGQFHGVTLTARVDSTVVELVPRHPYDRADNYPTFTAAPGRVDADQLARWLNTMRGYATNEREQLRNPDRTAPTPPSSPDQHTRFER